jgi:branched-chain amino acid transport system ATP-binding protein
MPNSGEIRIDGRATTGMRPCDLNRLGVSISFSWRISQPKRPVR